VHTNAHIWSLLTKYIDVLTRYLKHIYRPLFNMYLIDHHTLISVSSGGRRWVGQYILDVFICNMMFSSNMCTLTGCCTAVFSARGQCQQGWREYKNKCFFFSTDTKSWPEANAFCLGQYTNLMSILDIHERVSRHAQNRPPETKCSLKKRHFTDRVCCISCVISRCG